MQDSHTAFYKGGPSQTPVDLSSCAYLHNYFAEANDTLFAPQFAEITSASPVFTADDVDELSGFLATRLNAGNGADVLQRIEQSKYRRSKKLMDHVGNLIKGKPEYLLLDEQMVVYETVLAWARKGFHDRRPTVIVVRGGPGTGKSVIAMNLVGSFTPKAKGTDRPQVEELLEAAKIAVFFIDDKQLVRPNEIGSAAYIVEHADEGFTAQLRD